MSLIKIIPIEKEADYTLSKFLINNIPFCYCIEDEIREIKIHGETAIPEGEYQLGTRYSPKFSKSFYYSSSLNKLIDSKEYTKLSDKLDYKEHELIWIKEVPKFQYVLIHTGNTDDHTEGCLIVGGKPGYLDNQRAVLGSKDCYKDIYPRLYPEIKKGGRIIEITR